MQRLEPARFAGRLGGREVGLYRLQADGLQLAVCNHGARLLELIMPDRHGQPQDVVLGHDSLAQLLQGLPSMGAFIGRFANRLAGAQWSHAGRMHRLPANDGVHCLHGGPAGSRFQVFELQSHTPSALRLAWTFREAEDGFPGEVALVLDYRLEGGALHIDYSARVSDAATPLNFTSHAYFNLAGQAAPDALDHVLQIEAGHFVPVRPDRIPSGGLAEVAGTAFDFRSPRSVRDALAQGHAQLGQPPGFDHCFVDGQLGLRRQARLWSPQSGIAMEVWSDAPGLQLYSAAPLDGSLPRHAGKHGRVYGAAAGVCLEPQALPDAPHQPGFGRAVYAPGEQLKGRISYRFGLAD